MSLSSAHDHSIRAHALQWAQVHAETATPSSKQCLVLECVRRAILSLWRSRTRSKSKKFSGNIAAASLQNACVSRQIHLHTKSSPAQIFFYFCAAGAVVTWRRYGCHSERKNLACSMSRHIGAKSHVEHAQQHGALVGCAKTSRSSISRRQACLFLVLCVRACLCLCLCCK